MVFDLIKVKIFVVDGCIFVVMGILMLEFG